MYAYIPGDHGAPGNRRPTAATRSLRLSRFPRLSLLLSFFIRLFFPLWFFSDDSLFVRSIQNGKCRWNGIYFVIFTGDFIRRLDARLTMFETREVINKIERVELKNWEFDRQELSEYVLISVLIEELK